MKRSTTTRTSASGGRVASSSTTRASKTSHSSSKSNTSTKSSGSSHHRDPDTRYRDSDRESRPKESSRDARSKESSRDARSKESSRESRYNDSSRDSRPSDSGRGAGSSGHSRSSAYRDEDRLQSGSSDKPRSNSSRPINGQYTPQINGQRPPPLDRPRLPNESKRRQDGGPLSPGSPRTSRRAGGREGGGGRLPSPISPPPASQGGGGGRRRPSPHFPTQGVGGGPLLSHHDDAPARKSRLNLSMPSNVQLQETTRTFQDCTNAISQAHGAYQDARDMWRRNKQGGRPPPGQFDDQCDNREDFPGSPGGASPGGCGPGPGRGGGGGRNNDYAPSPGGGELSPGGSESSPGGSAYSPREDDRTPARDGGGPKPFDQWPTSNNSIPSGSPNGQDAGNSRDIDYVSKPNSNRYRPSEDKFTPSPAGETGQKRFDQWPATNAANASAPTSRRGPDPGPNGNRPGPSPLGPNGINQPQSKAPNIAPTLKFHFEKCSHTSEYGNRPCGAGPYNYSGSPAEWLKEYPIAYEGRCLACDTNFRRGQEQSHINAYEEAYQAALRGFKAQNRRDPVKGERDQIKTYHLGARGRKITEVWGSWNERWKTVVVVKYDEDNDGKAVLKAKVATN